MSSGIYTLRAYPHWSLLSPTDPPLSPNDPPLSPNWPLTISTDSHWPQSSPTDPSVASTEPHYIILTRQ